MSDEESSIPRPLPEFPSHPLTLSYAIQIFKHDRVTEVYVPRSPRLEGIDCDEDDVLELPFGYVPKVGITDFYIEGKNKTLHLQYDESEWLLDDEIDMSEVPGQLFVHLVKPYAGISRMRSHVNIYGNSKSEDES